MKIIVIAKSNLTPVLYYGGNISWLYFKEADELHIYDCNGKEIFSSYNAVLVDEVGNDWIRFVDSNYDDQEEDDGEGVRTE